MCPCHREGVCPSAHDGKPPLLQAVEDLRHVVRRLAATVLWLSGTPRDVATGEAGLKGKMLEIVATGDTDLKGQKTEVDVDQHVHHDGTLEKEVWLTGRESHTFQCW